jgi:hypothetical protein
LFPFRHPKDIINNIEPNTPVNIFLILCRVF